MNPLEYIQPFLGLFFSEERVPLLDRVFEIAKLLNPEEVGITSLFVIDAGATINPDEMTNGVIIIRKNAGNIIDETIATPKLIFIERAEAGILITGSTLTSQIFSNLKFFKSFEASEFVSSQFNNCEIRSGGYFKMNATQILETLIEKIDDNNNRIEVTDGIFILAELLNTRLEIDGLIADRTKFKGSTLLNLTEALGIVTLTSSFLKDCIITITATSGTFTLNSTEIFDSVISSVLPIICSGASRFTNCTFESDLKNCNFSGAEINCDFSDLDLTGTNFSGANLTGSIFSNNLFRDCDFGGATGTTNEELIAAARRLEESGYDFIGVDGSTITIGSLSSVTLTVTDEENNPVEGAIISLNTEPKGITNASGVLIIEEVEAGTNTVLITHDNYEDKTQDIEVDENTEAVTIENLTFKLSTVSFLVKDEDEAGISGADIFIDELKVSTTNESGEATAEVKFGERDLKITHADFIDYEETLTIDAPDKNVPVEMTNKLSEVTFHVISGQSNIEGAEIKIDTILAGVTNNQGLLAVSNVKYGTRAIEITAIGYVTQNHNETVNGTTEEFEYDLVSS